MREWKEIQSNISDPAFIGQIAAIAADALHAQHRPDADAGSETEGV